MVLGLRNTQPLNKIVQKKVIWDALAYLGKRKVLKFHLNLNTIRKCFCICSSSSKGNESFSLICNCSEDPCFSRLRCTYSKLQRQSCELAFMSRLLLTELDPLERKVNIRNILRMDDFELNQSSYKDIFTY